MQRPKSTALAFALLVIGVHSLVLGALILVAPRAVLEVVHWPEIGPVFFPAQSGLFLVILGGMYLAGIWHRPYAWAVVGSKGAAVVFLGVTTAMGLAPAIVGWQALVDGAMGLVVLVLLLRELRRSEAQELT